MLFLWLLSWPGLPCKRDFWFQWDFLVNYSILACKLANLAIIWHNCDHRGQHWCFQYDMWTVSISVYKQQLIPIVQWVVNIFPNTFCFLQKGDAEQRTTCFIAAGSYICFNLLNLKKYIRNFSSKVIVRIRRPSTALTVQPTVVVLVQYPSKKDGTIGLYQNWIGSYVLLTSNRKQLFRKVLLNQLAFSLKTMNL